MTISAVIMTYNEEEYLPITLPPILDFCEEIVILDMGSVDKTIDVCTDLLRETDIVVSYARRNLFSFGFSHPRNYASRFVTGDWVLSIDADELVSATEFRTAFAAAAVGPSVFDLERRNYGYVEGIGLASPDRIAAEAPFSVERHRRLYRSAPRIRFEGLIHEELWDGDESAFASCGALDLTIHHLSAYRTRLGEGDKHELYAYLLLKAQAYPGFRHGTNPWFFETYVPENIEVLLHQANNFAVKHKLSTFDRSMMKK